MTNKEASHQPTRQRLTEKFLERYRYHQPVTKLVETNTALERQFQFPKEVWDKIKAR